MKRLIILLALASLLSGCAAVKGTTMTYTGLSHPTLVQNRLYLMNRYQANDPVLLKELGVTARVNIASQVTFGDDIPGVRTFNVHISERDCPETWQKMGFAVQLVEALMQDGYTVADNCWFGENRSALLDAIILSRADHIGVREAFDRLKLYRPEIYWKPWMNGYRDVFKWLK